MSVARHGHLIVIPPMNSSHPVLLTTMYYHSIFDLFKDVKATKKICPPTL